MIHYVVIAGRTTAIDRLAPKLLRALDETGVLVGERIEHTARGWAAAAICAPDPFCRTRFVATEDEMLLLNGPAVAIAGDQEEVCANVLDALRLGGTGAVARASRRYLQLCRRDARLGSAGRPGLLGVLSLVLGPRPGLRGLFEPVIDRRRVLGSDAWDLKAFSWIIGHASLWGESMPANDVVYLLPGHEARVDADGQVHTEISATSAWPTPDEDAERSDLTAGEWDEITESLVDNFRALHGVSDPLTLFMTGGKDSRLCLALAKAAGLQSQVRAVTTGGPDSPEVEVARRVAEAAGIEFERKGIGAKDADAPAAPAPRAFDPEVIWRRLEQHLYRHEAIVCPWDGTRDAGSTALNIKGFGGEVYRGPGGHSKQFHQDDPIDLDEMAERFVRYHQRPDPLGVLLPAVASWQAAWLREWVYENAKRVRLDVLPEKFFLDYRIGHWNGPMCQATPRHIKLVPLMSQSAMERNFELSALARNDEHLHYEVMCRTAPEMVSIPFLNSVWSERLVTSGQVETPREEYPTKVKASTACFAHGSGSSSRAKERRSGVSSKRPSVMEWTRSAT